MNGLKNEEIEIITSRVESPHIHSEVELIFILEGEAEVVCRNSRFRMSAGDVIVFNSEELHGWNAFTDILLCRISMSYYDLRKEIGRKSFHIECNSAADRETDFSRLAYFVRAILKAYVDEEGGFRLKSLYYLLWELIRKQFLRTGASERSGDDRKTEEILRYVRAHLSEQISLSDLAEKWYMSASAFSRYFKNRTGQGFAEYVRMLRIENAKRELAEGNRMITEIALDNGFRNVSVFNRVFKEQTGMTPTVFRSQGEKEHDSGDPQEAIHSVREYLERNESIYAEREEQEQIVLDMSRPVKYMKVSVEGIVGKYLEELQERRLQEQLLLTVSRLGIRCIKICNVLENVIEKGNRYPVSQMDFERIDSVLDFLVDHNLKPFIELPLREDKLIAAIGTPLIRRDDPSDHEEQEKQWRYVLRAFLEHITQRYGLSEVSGWKFEIWCNIDWADYIRRYENVYEDTYRLIRRYLPGAQIGGCNLNVTVSKEALKEILVFWRSRNIVPDFLTLMSYPYSVRENQEGKLVLCNIYPDAHFVRKDAEEYRALLEELSYPQLPLCVSEWNTSLSERNSYNDSCAKACHMLTQMIDMAQIGAPGYYSRLSDLTSRYYDSPEPFIGASGLISKDGIFKPSYYAMEFWSKLGNQYVDSGEHFIATRLNDGSIRILVFNGKGFGRDYYLQEEDQITPQKLQEIYKNTNRLTVKIELKNLKKQQYCMRSFRLKEGEGSVLAEWRKLGETKSLMREEVSYLRKKCIPYMELEWLSTPEYQAGIELSLDCNEIVMLLIQ